MISLTAPLLNAITGVPTANASIWTMPKGSFHLIGKSNPFDFPTSSFLSFSLTSPKNSIFLFSLMQGLTSVL
jgi:hypothetical protein